MAKVTIATSVYNTEPWLERCLNSFIHQTFTDLEIIIVDNACTDHSPEIIKKFADADPRIRVITLSQNIGPGGGYGEAMKALRTDYFTFCDSDDYIEPDYVEVLYNKLVETDADLSMCNAEMVWPDGRAGTPRKLGRDAVLTREDIPDILPQMLDYTGEYLGYPLGHLGILWGKLYKTDFIRKNHLIYTQEDWFAGDWFFHFKLFKHFNKMAYADDILYHWFQADGSVTRSTRMSWDRYRYTENILYKFESEAQDVMTPSLRKALNIFYFHTSLNLLGMYYSNYPDTVTKEDIFKVCRDVTGWKMLKQITFFHHAGLTFRDTLKLRVLEHRCLIPIMVRRAKRRERLSMAAKAAD